MEGNATTITGLVKRWPRRYIDLKYGEDRVAFSMTIPTTRNTGPSTCIVDVSAETEDVRDVALELREGDRVEVSGWLRARSKKVNGRTDRQVIVEVIVESIIILPDQGSGESPPDSLRPLTSLSPGRV